jgi:DNA-binding NarL/FixJ family response regulator
VVGVVTDGRDLADAVTTLKPDIVLLDIYMSRLNGLDAGEQVKKKRPAIKLIFLTMTLAADVVAEAFRRRCFRLRSQAVIWY